MDTPGVVCKFVEATLGTAPDWLQKAVSAARSAKILDSLVELILLILFIRSTFYTLNLFCQLTFVSHYLPSF